MNILIKVKDTGSAKIMKFIRYRERKKIFFCVNFFFTSFFGVIFFWAGFLEEPLVEVSGCEAEYVESLVLLLARVRGRGEGGLDGGPDTRLLTSYQHPSTLTRTRKPNQYVQADFYQLVKKFNPN